VELRVAGGEAAFCGADAVATTSAGAALLVHDWNSEREFSKVDCQRGAAAFFWFAQPREHPNHICQTKQREDSPVSVQDILLCYADGGRWVMVVSISISGADTLYEESQVEERLGNPTIERKECIPNGASEDNGVMCSAEAAWHTPPHTSRSLLFCRPKKLPEAYGLPLL
jgi:hypothetical protein